MDYYLVALLSYLLGSIPFGFLLTKIFLKKILGILDQVILEQQMY
ncbi:MAG: hypothetical protein ACJZ8F_06460 [Candidatus Pelagibacter sp.]